ncbi:MAG: NHLP family bacteriocin export ABC transporter peptidase/permease/ATPase subunit [Clostridia bacterium]|nr:NHLP family bacteriocin export ABC transporter peptidase/permease/ATPase subunit [Clostridia bacterium]
MNKKLKEPVKKGAAKVPVILQMEALECGAASLTMILAYYDKWIPLEQVRQDCGVSRDGANALNVMRAARQYGLEAKGYRYELEAIKDATQFPCIIHWNFNHFVVLCGFSGNRAIINDPARGTVKVTMEEFDRSFTGVCIMLRPTEAFVPSGKRKSTLDFARKRLEGAAAPVLFVVLTTIIGYLFGIINPGLSRIFMDRILTGQNRELTQPFLLFMVLMAVIQIIVALARTIYSLKINSKLAIVGNSTFIWKILKMPMAFFSQRMAGDIQQRQSTNADIAETLINTLAPLVLDSIMMIFYLVVMIRYSPVLALFGVSTMVLNLLISNRLADKRMEISRVMVRDEGKLSSATVSGIQMIETIKASGAENGFFEKWSGYHASVNAGNVRMTYLSETLGAIPVLLGMLADSAIVICGVYMAITGNFTLGMIIAFQGFLSSFMGPTQNLISASTDLQQMRVMMERIDDVMNYPDDPHFSDAPMTDDESYAKLTGQIELKNVTFGYSPLSPPLIENFNMSMKTGQRIAFVGFSGCGKSTLSKLISGLYTPWSGEILFDGKPISEINRNVFTGSVAVVDQEITLFEDTIANNIKMWDDSIADFEMILAARDAQIHEDIMRRDGGYQYRLAEGGRDLSGGQRQRLEIARVLAQDPTILIMDEATSALDAKTEYDLVKAVKERGITCIVIAHRLSTIRDCDEIIVLDHGQVVERGTHDELYRKGGAYAQMIASD